MELTLYNGLTAALTIMVLGCTFAVPALALLLEISGLITGKVFMDKLAWQTSRLGVILALPLALVTGAAWLGSEYFKAFTVPDTVPGLMNPGLSEDILPGLPLISPAFLILYTLLWKKTRQFKAVHLLLGAAGTAGMLGFLSLLAWSLYRMVMNISSTLPGPESIFYSIMVQAGLISMAAAAGLSMVYLLIRRSEDDFGRDYYRFALSLVARWGMLFAALSPLVCVWTGLLIRSELDFSWLALPGAAYILALLILILFFRKISRSSQPLRHKAIIAVCPVVTWFILVARLVSWLEMSNIQMDTAMVEPFLRQWPGPLF